MTAILLDQNIDHFEHMYIYTSIVYFTLFLVLFFFFFKEENSESEDIVIMEDSSDSEDEEEGYEVYIIGSV